MGQAVAAAGCLMTAVKICGEVYRAKNQPIDDDANEFEDEEASGETYVLICALDYKKTGNALTCSIDGRNMEELCEACDIPRENVRAMYDEQCTKENVEEAIEEMLGQCGANDNFVFYYSGHGTSMKDQTGDEADGQDEAFCFVTADGQISYESCMTDDHFAQVVTDSIQDDEVHVVILTDCCHSGSICDFGTAKGAWHGKKAVSIAGCEDNQTSGDLGRGGIFTHSMLMAIQELQEEEEESYNVAKLYNVTLDKDNSIFHSAQDIEVQSAPGFLPTRMPWPLIPKQPYTSPYNRH